MHHPGLASRVVLACGVAVLLFRVFSLQRVFQLFSRAPLRRVFTCTDAEIKYVVGYLDKIFNAFGPERFQQRCLTRALVIRLFLSPDDPSEVVIGVRKRAPALFEGHCWIEGPLGPAFESENSLNRFIPIRRFRMHSAL